MICFANMICYCYGVSLGVIIVHLGLGLVHCIHSILNQKEHFKNYHTTTIDLGSVVSDIEITDYVSIIIPVVKYSFGFGFHYMANHERKELDHERKVRQIMNLNLH